MRRVCRTWLCRWEYTWFYLPKVEFGFKLGTFLTQTFHFQKLSRKKKSWLCTRCFIKIAFHSRGSWVHQWRYIHKDECCKSVKRMCRQCFPNWPLPVPRGCLSCFSSCLWFGGGVGWSAGRETIRGEGGQGTGKVPLLFQPLQLHFYLLHVLGL